MHKQPILECQHIQKRYGDKIILQDLSLSIGEGEVVGLLGPNGAGKTTLFYILLGFLRCDTGSIYFKETNITRYPTHERARLGMGYLAQEPSIFRSLTVEQNILCILETLPLSKKERHMRLEEVLLEFHLKEIAKKKASLLSGGEKRRVEIARVLATQPKLLLLDEPFANIDPKTISDLKNIIRHLKAKNISILITDHNAKELFTIVDKSFLIAQGTILASGSSRDLLQNQDAKLAYFGSDFILN
ncbi:MAG: LPS export ABC transporter ATP-binding protein [Verrucomicrobia bacterium]|nr:LPS export ABC transporter ATP-binding protein [Verrucomicrobiota bacterium]